jgi:hypothetical protein
VKALLDDIPKGQRAISLEGNTMYYLETANLEKVFQDPLRFEVNGSAASFAGPWMDLWSEVLAKRFGIWFQNFSALGGTVDLILGDFEMGGSAAFYRFSHQTPSPKHNMRTNESWRILEGGIPLPQQLLQQDSRWPALKARLEAVGGLYNARSPHPTNPTPPTYPTPRHFRPHSAPLHPKQFKPTQIHPTQPKTINKTPTHLPTALVPTLLPQCSIGKWECGAWGKVEGAQVK